MAVLKLEEAWADIYAQEGGQSLPRSLALQQACRQYLAAQWQRFKVMDPDVLDAEVGVPLVMTKYTPC